MSGKEYREELRQHFMEQFTKFDKSSSAKHKDHMTPNPLKLDEYASGYTTNRKTQKHQQMISGGDADRVLHETTTNFTTHNGCDTYRTVNGNNDAYYINHLYNNRNRSQAPTIPPSSSLSNKYATMDPNTFKLDSDSNFGDGHGGAGSEDSNKTNKTIQSIKSSHDLRKMVLSQCKIHEVVNETLQQMCNSETEPASEDIRHMSRLKELPMQLPSKQKQQNCKRCSERLPNRSSQKDVTTEIAKGDFLDCRAGDTLTISVDDVVNSKVINPMIRKLQRMYLNNLKEEMSLMEDLERLPHKVNEVYKATIFKQKD